MLNQQRCGFNKEGLGYIGESSKSKVNSLYHVKSKETNNVTPFTKCSYRNRNGHSIYMCNVRSHSKVSHLSSISTPLVRKWQKPPPGPAKINSNTALGNNTKTSIGIVIRDNTGKVMGCCFDSWLGHLDVLSTEAIYGHSRMTLLHYTLSECRFWRYF